MGRSIRLTCNDCKEYIDLNIGQSRSDNKLDRVLGHFDGQTSDLIKEKLSLLGEDAYWNYCSMIGYCESCGSYSEIPTFTIKDNGKDYVTAGKCSCGSTCELIDDNDQTRMNDLRCPKCQGRMTVETTGMWD